MKNTWKIERKREALSLLTGITFANVPGWFHATRRDLKMDVIMPKAWEGHAPCPCVVWICGGAYMMVDRSVWIPELMQIARAGYVVASIEYRTSNEAQFPAQLTDVKAAIRYLRAHAKQYCVDPERIYAMGESAGGTMACLLGVTAGHPEFEQGDYPEESSHVSGIVDFYGITDVSREAVRLDTGVPSWTMDAFLGEGFQSEQATVGSAISYVSEHTPPCLIFHGLADNLVPVTQSTAFYKRLKAKGVPAQLYLLEGAAHGDDLFYQDEVIEKVVAFLNCLAGKE